MKKSLNVFWIISACFLAIAALWGSVSGLSGVMAVSTVCGISLVVFGVISVLASFTIGVKANGSGWLIFDGISSFFTGLAFIFGYVDRSLFTVDLIYILGLWLIFLGMSQVARNSKGSKGSGRFFGTATGVLGVVGGLSLYVRPISDFLLISEAMKLCAYTSTFLLLIAAVMVLCRLISK